MRAWIGPTASMSLRLGNYHCRSWGFQMHCRPIQDIPQLPKSAQEVLSVVGLILECLQHALASGTGPWD
jgi:hypothetical protein